MADSTLVFKGVVHGRTVELDRPVELPDGQAVTVALSPAPAKTLEEREAIFRRAFGAWADDDPKGLDAYLEQVRLSRKQERPAEP